jgi:polygalacturonase
MKLFSHRLFRDAEDCLMQMNYHNWMNPRIVKINPLTRPSRKSAVSRAIPFFCLLAIFVQALMVKVSAVVPWSILINTNNVVNITNYGASVNNADNSSYIQQAINAAAAGGATNGLRGGTVEVPTGIFLSGPFTLTSGVNLQLDSGAILRMLPFGQYPLTYTTNISGGTTSVTWSASSFISANNASDIEISGSGAIDGQGSGWWPYSTNTSDGRAFMISFGNCDRQLIENVTLSNSPMTHIQIGGSGAANTTVQGVTVFAPGTSPNTDACDMAGTNVLVENCNISEGDDDFACAGETSDVLITNNTYGTGHGISIGSNIAGGVANIMVINCTMNGTANGLRIKSDAQIGSFVTNVTYCNISMTNVSFPILVYAYYLEVGTPNNVSPATAAAEPLTLVTGYTPQYSNITFSNITATAASGYPEGIVWARTELPATNIIFDKVNLSGGGNFCLYNVSGAQFIDCNLAPPATSNTFALFNAQVVVSNSVPTHAVSTFNGLTTNSYANSLALYGADGSLKNTNVLGSPQLTLSSSILTVSNNLAMNSSSLMNFTLGTNAATIAAISNLTVGGIVNISAGGGFTSGTYTLMTCGGQLGGSVPQLDATPANYVCNIQTNSAGQVNLVVLLPSVPAPTNLVAVPTNGTIELSWSPVADATGYNVQRSVVSGGLYTNIAYVTGTNYTDTQVVAGINYFYVVAGTNNSGEGANSAQVAANLSNLSFVPAKYRSNGTGGGNWSAPSTWQISTNNGANWNPSGTVPGGADSVEILSGDTVTISTTGMTINQVVVDHGGRLSVGDGVTTLAHATSPDLDIHGTLYLPATNTTGSTLTLAANAAVVIESDGVLQSQFGSTSDPFSYGTGCSITAYGLFVLNTAAGTVSTCTWMPGSTLNYSPTTDSGTGAPLAGMNQSFYNLVFNMTNQTSAGAGMQNFTNVQGSLTVNSTGSGSGRLALLSNGGETLTIGGNVYINGTSKVYLFGNSSSSASATFESSLYVASTAYVGNSYKAKATTVNNIVFAGSGAIALGPGTIDSSTGGGLPAAYLISGNYVLEGNWTLSSSATSTAFDTLTVSGMLDCFTNNILNNTVSGGGANTFTLNSGAILGVGSTNGIRLTGITGNIRISGNRSFSGSASYIYDGVAAQITGGGLPASVNNFTVTNTALLKLGQNETVNGILQIGTNASLDFNSNTITTANAPALNGGLTMEEIKNGSTFSGSKLTQTAGTLSYGGTLTVTTAGNPLADGDVITLFSAPAYEGGGGFNSANLPALSSGLSWSTAGLVENGSIEIISPPVGPAVLSNSISGSLLTLTWPAHQGWRLVSQTNSLSIGLTTNGWGTVGGGIDGSNSMAIDPTNPAVFFRLVYP